MTTAMPPLLSDTAKSLMLQLDQLVAALQMVRGAREDYYNMLRARYNNSLESVPSSMQKELTGSRRALTMALITARLCATSGSQTRKHMLRLQKLAGACLEHTRLPRSDEWKGDIYGHRFAFTAGAHTARFQESHTLLEASLTSYLDTSSRFMLEGDVADLPSQIGLLSADLSSAERYFRNNPYARPKQGHEVFKGTRKQSLAIVTPVDFSFATVTVPKTPLWPRDPAHVCEKRLEYNFLDSLCLSPTTPDTFKNDTQAVYLGLCDSVHEKWSEDDRPKDWSLYLPFSYDPLHWAEALREISFVVGFIFDDDPSVVVWPTGNTGAESGHLAIVYCRKPCRYLWQWHYRAIVISPASHTAIADVDSNTTKDTRSRFLTLPSELRNRIYTFCLQPEEQEYPDPYDVPTLRDASAPTLSRTCRQVRDEFTPMYLSCRQWSVEARINRENGQTDKPANAVFSRENYWLTQLPTTASFRHIKITIRLDEGEDENDPVECCLHIDLNNTDKNRASISRLRVFSGSRRCSRVKQYEHELKELIDMLLEDGDGEGLTLTDLAAIVDFCLRYAGSPE